jgi:hypothetical protein
MEGISGFEILQNRHDMIVTSNSIDVVRIQRCEAFVTHQWLSILQNPSYTFWL